MGFGAVNEIQVGLPIACNLSDPETVSRNSYLL